MSEITFSKTLTANDTGETGAHQAGLHIPKGERALIDFLPSLDNTIKNPDAWIECVDEHERRWSFRYIHYNNKFFDPKGTRDEYRLTHLTRYLREIGAQPNDYFLISRKQGLSEFNIRLKKCAINNGDNEVHIIKLQGWSRVH